MPRRKDQVKRRGRLLSLTVFAPLAAILLLSPSALAGTLVKVYAAPYSSAKLAVTDFRSTKGCGETLTVVQPGDFSLGSGALALSANASIVSCASLRGHALYSGQLGLSNLSFTANNTGRYVLAAHWLLDGWVNLSVSPARPSYYPIEAWAQVNISIELLSSSGGQISKSAGSVYANGLRGGSLSTLLGGLNAVVSARLSAGQTYYLETNVSFVIAVRTSTTVATGHTAYASMVFLSGAGLSRVRAYYE